MARMRSATAPGSAAPLRERAYAYIQRKIASGELNSEMPISELVMAKELKISRTPIREAIGQLVAEGILDQTPNRGTVVVQLGRQDIIDLYELREALEVYSARKAAQLSLQSVRSIDLQRLQCLSNEIQHLKGELEKSGKAALNAEQMHRFLTSDLSFHNMLMRIATNSRILKVVK